MIAPDLTTSDMKKVLTIAGSDCSGGAGVQADIKTITVHKAYAMSVITALTAQNTLGVAAIAETPPEFVAQQMKAVFEDIRPDAVKIGMTSSSEIIMTIALNLRQYAAQNIVLDPVMAAESGGKLLRDNAVEALIRYLLPVADLITPNLHEAEILSGMSIASEDDMVAAAAKIRELTPAAILIKGGHLMGDANDLLLANGQIFWYKSERVANPNNHGTGCTLSSAIACHLAEGDPPAQAVYKAKQFLLAALKAGLDLGHGKGPLNHTCLL
jgi:hydroxymethylpyrimidine/phosphomethylpyrimidine kinase